VALSRAPADDDDEACAARVLAELGVGDLGEAFGAAVLDTERRASGGERQWIAVARALATGLPVLLLDEPTSALDPGSQERMLGALARLRGKRTVLLVTHRPEPLAIADVVLHL
jgi:ABC-type transport system involved in cytochrome bd biosynthesis fused ATPase/permease subunit